MSNSVDCVQSRYPGISDQEARSQQSGDSRNIIKYNRHLRVSDAKGSHPATLLEEGQVRGSRVQALSILSSIARLVTRVSTAAS
eukprot:1984622-Amphidinium_carterae.1